MRNSLSTYLFLSILFVLVILSSCKKEYSAEKQPQVPNRPPVARAGNDLTVNYPDSTATLDGSGSYDPDGNIDHYEWTEISGPSVCNIQNPNANRTSVSALILGDYQMQLKVVDAAGLVSQDTVVISVISTQFNHWTQLTSVSANDFFFGPRDWFDGANLLIGINNQVFAASNHGSFWGYDSSSNLWTAIGTFPEIMQSEPIVFSIGGKGYFIGGGHCWEYEPSQNIWTRKNDPPFNFKSPLVINNKVYLQASNQFYSYDSQTDSYAYENNLPFSATNPLLGYFVVNGKGFYINSNKQCWQYNVVANNWLQKSSLVESGNISNTSSFSLNDGGYIIGDLNGLSYNSSLPMKVWRYDTTLDQWNQYIENYPGWGAYDISVAPASNVVYVGLGYTNGDFNAVDFWRFHD